MRIPYAPPISRFVRAGWNVASEGPYTAPVEVMGSMARGVFWHAWQSGCSSEEERLIWDQEAEISKFSTPTILSSNSIGRVPSCYLGSCGFESSLDSQFSVLVAQSARAVAF